MTFRYRRLADNLADPLKVGGDMTFGRGGQCFLVDNPTAVAQAVLTRLRRLEVISEKLNPAGWEVVETSTGLLFEPLDGDQDLARRLAELGVHDVFQPVTSE